jgi:molybdopterin/thiamine biosynthesis adenylyltransferase
MTFEYNTAFSRNLGWLSKQEQKIISNKVIAIPGMGGVGGHHLHSLARLGYQNFKIADFDEFDTNNTNRQIGSTILTKGRHKAEVMKEMILAINPNAKIEIFKDGVNPSNYSDFLNKVDIVVDGLDVYVIKPRIELFDMALRKDIPVVTAGPLGMGTSIISFNPKGMNFSDYFNINTSMSDSDLLVHFMAGLAPSSLHFQYLFHEDVVNIAEGNVPSLHTGVLAATTAVAAEVTKISLNRGSVKYAPHSSHYDFYLNRLKKIWRPGGNKNILQRLAIAMIRKKFEKLS